MAHGWSASRSLAVFLRPGGQLCRGKSRGDAASVAAGRMVFAAVGILSEYIVTSAGKITQATAPNWRFVQILRPRRVLSSRVVGSAEKITMATPQERRLLLVDVRPLVLFRLLRELRWGETRRRRYRRNSSLNFFAGVTFARPRGRFRRGN